MISLNNMNQNKILNSISSVVFLSGWLLVDRLIINVGKIIQLRCCRRQTRKSSHNASSDDPRGTFRSINCTTKEPDNLHRAAGELTGCSTSHIAAGNAGNNWWKCWYSGVYIYSSVSIWFNLVENCQMPCSSQAWHRHKAWAPLRSLPFGPQALVSCQARLERATQHFSSTLTKLFGSFFREFDFVLYLQVYLNCPGGSTYSVLAIYDCMSWVRSCGILRFPEFRWCFLNRDHCNFWWGHKTLNGG